MKLYPLLEFDRALGQSGLTEKQIDRVESEIRFLMPEILSPEPLEATAEWVADFKRRLNADVFRNVPFELAISRIRSLVEKASKNN